MQTTRPDFLDSEYFYIDEKGWQIKDEAPEKMKIEFKEYMEQVSRSK